MSRNFVEDLKELTNGNVHIKNPLIVNEKINGIITDGTAHLQVVSDFDLTITKQHEAGKRHISSFRMFAYCPSVTQEYLDTTSNLFEKYYPKEIDPTIPIDIKTDLINEWYIESEKALIGLKVSPKELDETVSKLENSFRDGTQDLIRTLLAQNVPVIVFSAGLGDSVVAALKHNHALFDNVKVVSNFLKYSEDGTIEGFKGPLIHVYNKNEAAIRNSDFGHLVQDRNNVILMGDSLGDSKMTDGMSNGKHVLKIGFLYGNVQENLPAYLDTFDIVLEDDQTMNVASAIIALLNE